MNSKPRFVGFDELKRSVSIEQVLNRYGLIEHLRRSGDSLTGTCPLHDGHNPTQFRVSLSKNCWICFGNCHTGGSIVDFVSRKEGVGIREAAVLIQDWFGVTASDAVHDGRNGHNRKPPTATTTSAPDDQPEPRFNPPLQEALSNLVPTHPYLAERGLDPDTIATFGLGYCPCGSLAGWIAIPIHNPVGELVGYAARWPGTPPIGRPKYRLPKGFRKSLELFNLHRAIAQPPEQPLVVVEGYFGVMKLWQSGVRRVVALMGNTLSPAQEELIREHTTAQSGVILMLDEDEAGRAARQEISQRLARFVFVKTHVFDVEGQQPEELSHEDIHHALEGPP